jgi:hypothetical protein
MGWVARDKGCGQKVGQASQKKVSGQNDEAREGEEAGKTGLAGIDARFTSRAGAGAGGLGAR